jgi:ABC-type polysaccharide/polyol phosphate export permease
VYFPREIFPFSSVLVCLVDFAVGASVLVGLMFYYKITPTAWILFLPVVLIVSIAFTAAMSLILAMANLFYRDVKYLFELVVSVWMFASSVLYPVEAVSPKLAVVGQLNPMTPIIDGYRAALLGIPLPHPNAFLLAAAVSFAALGLAWSWFHKAEYSFAENI